MVNLFKKKKPITGHEPNHPVLFHLGVSSPNPFDLKDLDSGLLPAAVGASGIPGPAQTGTKPKKSVQTLLGEHSNLVNLDNLVSDSQPGEKPKLCSSVILNFIKCLCV